MGYIEELRKLVGNYPIILVGSAVLITDRYAKLLLLRRTDNESWGIPGGAMEPGESLADTARRETFEETGLVIEEMTFFDVFSGQNQHYVYPNGSEVYNVSVVYTCQHVNGILRIDPAEHTEARYFSLQALPVPLSPPIIPVIEKLVQNGGI